MSEPRKAVTEGVLSFVSGKFPSLVRPFIMRSMLDEGDLVSFCYDARNM